MPKLRGKQIEDNGVTATQAETATGTISTVNAGDAAVEGSGAGLSRRDHQHAVSTGGTTAQIDVGDAAAEGSSSALAREDHQHALPAPAAPANVTKAAAAAGAAATVARADHKHDVDTATAVEITDSTNSEGSATSLARSDHGHAHGNRGGGALHPGATTSVAGFMSAIDKQKLDTLEDAAGLDVKELVRAATVAAGTLATDFENLDVIDGVTLATGDRILIKNQASAIENGIYTVNASGAPTRATDMDTGDSASGARVFADQGTVNADTGFFCTTNKPSDIVGTDGLAFVIYSGGTPRGAGAGLILTGNDLDVVAGDSSITVNPNDITVGVISDTQHGARGGGTQHADVVAAGASGFMTGADKTKIDGITAGAQPNDTDRQEAVTTQVITGTDTALTDTLNFTPISDASVVLYLNGLEQRQGAGADYTISGSTITWLASTGIAVDMDTTDVLDAKYLS